MTRASRRLFSALGASAAIHVAGSIVFWHLLADRVASIAVASPAAVARSDRAPSVPVPIAVAKRHAAAPEKGSTEVRVEVAGDVDREVAHPSAPTPAPNPDRFADRAAASSGRGLGVREFSLTGRRDDEQLRVQLFNSTAGYQLQRIRTGDARTSREDVRATPNPGFTPNLASQAGRGRARNRPGVPALGHRDRGRVLAGREGAVADAGVGRAIRRDPFEGRSQGRISKDGEDVEGFARPLIARGPAATDASRPSERVVDRSDSAMVSSERHPGRIELSHPGVIGDGTSGRGSGDLPAWAASGQGVEAVPAGDPRATSGDQIALATYRRQYDQYLSEIKRKVDPLWELPHDLALRLEQGDVLVIYVIRRDGSLKNVKVIKTSGFQSFDRVVVAAIRHAAPFRPLPSVFGEELQVTSHFDGANPVVR